MRRTPLLLLPPLVLLAGCGSAATGSATGHRTAAPSSAPLPGTTSPATGTAPAPTGGPAAVPAEKNPPGDIPDNIAFVRYANTTGRYSFTHPEGWAETTRAATVAFTDKLNGVKVLPGAATTAPTVPSARARDVAALSASQQAFQLEHITPVSLPAGVGVRIVYRRNSAPDPVTGRQYRDEVERYELVRGGREVVVELYGPVGADNVDAYRTMITSLRFA